MWCTSTRADIQSQKYLQFQESVDINETTPGKVTALHLAAQYGHYALIECLVGWGAALNRIDVLGNTPLWLVVSHKKNTTLFTPQLKLVCTF